MSRKSQSPERRALRVCRSKKSYSTAVEAGIAKAAFWMNNGTILAVYECADHFHLTSKNNEKV